MNSINKKLIDSLKDSKNEDDRKKCIPLLRNYLEQFPEDAVAWYDLAGCFDFCGLETEAEPCYQKSYDLDWQKLPKHKQPGFFVGFGSTLRNNNKLKESEKILSEGIKYFPLYPALKVFLALTLYSLKNYEESSKILFKATLEMPEKSFDGYEHAIKWYVENLN